MSYALQAESSRSIKVNHNQYWDADSIKEMLGLAHKSLTEYKDVSQFLAGKRWNADTLVEYFNQVFPNTGSSKEELLEIAEGFVTPVENIDLSGENFDIPTV